MSEHDPQLASDLRLAVLRLNRRLRAQRTDARVSLTHISALSTLHLLGPMTPGALAAKERVQPPSMTRIIAVLENLGFIGRAAHPTDGRQVIVSVLPPGAEYLQAEINAREAWLDSRLSELKAEQLHTLRAASDIIEQMVRSTE
ncbi:MAG: MarR family transcriptional regulator [Actinomycetota bacterium]|nr:MarR family transcriptional regulator [Actinomycetota bacterium]